MVAALTEPLLLFRTESVRLSEAVSQTEETHPKKRPYQPLV